MSAIETAALALALPENLAFDDWLAKGRSLALSKKHMDFLIGDWIAFGRQHFPEQIQEVLPGMFDDERQLKRIEKTARAFPPSQRCASLSFEHHAHVADLPTQDALPLLREAEREKLPAKKLRIKAMLRKVETGQILPREEDAEDDALMALVRAWNRAPVSVREEFAELVADSALGLIEA
jgi:hypothetical protein